VSDSSPTAVRQQSDSRSDSGVRQWCPTVVRQWSDRSNSQGSGRVSGRIVIRLKLHHLVHKIRWCGEARTQAEARRPRCMPPSIYALLRRARARAPRANTTRAPPHTCARGSAPLSCVVKRAPRRLARTAAGALLRPLLNSSLAPLPARAPTRRAPTNMIRMPRPRYVPRAPGQEPPFAGPPSRGRAACQSHHWPSRQSGAPRAQFARRCVAAVGERSS